MCTVAIYLFSAFSETNYCALNWKYIRSFSHPPSWENGAQIGGERARIIAPDAAKRLFIVHANRLFAIRAAPAAPRALLIRKEICM